jgi:hypothetical protein
MDKLARLEAAECDRAVLKQEPYGQASTSSEGNTKSSCSAQTGRWSKTQGCSSSSTRNKGYLRRYEPVHLSTLCCMHSPFFQSMRRVQVSSKRSRRILKTRVCHQNGLVLLTGASKEALERAQSGL